MPRAGLARLKDTADLVTTRKALVEEVAALKELSRRAKQRLIDVSRRLNDSLLISTLPAEVLGYIFEEVVEDDFEWLLECRATDNQDWTGGRRHADDMNFQLSHVCHRWPSARETAFFQRMTTR